MEWCGEEWVMSGSGLWTRQTVEERWEGQMERWLEESRERMVWSERN